MSEIEVKQRLIRVGSHQYPVLMDSKIQGYLVIIQMLKRKFIKHKVQDCQIIQNYRILGLFQALNIMGTPSLKIRLIRKPLKLVTCKIHLIRTPMIT